MYLTLATTLMYHKELGQAYAITSTNTIMYTLHVHVFVCTCTLNLYNAQVFHSIFVSINSLYMHTCGKVWLLHVYSNVHLEGYHQICV